MYIQKAHISLYVYTSSTTLLDCILSPLLLEPVIVKSSPGALCCCVALYKRRGDKIQSSSVVDDVYTYSDIWAMCNNLCGVHIIHYCNVHGVYLDSCKPPCTRVPVLYCVLSCRTKAVDLTVVPDGNSTFSTG